MILQQQSTNYVWLLLESEDLKKNPLKTEYFKSDRDQFQTR